MEEVVPPSAAKAFRRNSLIRAGLPSRLERQASGSSLLGELSSAASQLHKGDRPTQPSSSSESSSSSTSSSSSSS